MSNLSTGTEQLVFALAHTCTTDGRVENCTAPEFLSTAFPGPWSTPAEVQRSFASARPPWKSGELARWFAPSARAMQVPFAEYGYGGLWWRPRRGTPSKGWLFASATLQEWPAHTEKPAQRVMMFIEHNGERWSQDIEGRASGRVHQANFLVTGGELHISALLKMAAMLKLVEPKLQLARLPMAPSTQASASVLFPS